MMYLLDTNVISELRKARIAEGKSGKADRRVTAWSNGVPAESMFLSVISILELEQGILQIERRDALQGKMLRSWLDHLILPAFSSRILLVDTAVALRCASLHVPNPRSYRDALIAATALVHGMTMVTRNVKDFESTGVAIVNPWQA
jgi:predicted nucleic acid-binding protein